MSPSSEQLRHRSGDRRGLGRHLRRHGLAYAALTLALAFSPVPSMAGALVTTDDIANGAVTGPKLGANSVSSAKVANGSLTRDDIRNGSITPTEVADLDWHNLRLTNGWQNYNGTARRPAWAIDVQGIVHLRGAVDRGTSTIFAELPAAVRPSAPLHLPTRVCSGGAPADDEGFGRISIFSDGAMHAFAERQDLAYCLTNLEGITWAN